MGQKVNPVGFRTGVVRGWKSRWYASKQDFSNLLIEDSKIRNFIKNHPKRPQYRSAGIDRIEIERTRDEVRVVLYVARPGLIIGKKGQEVEILQDELQNLTGRRVNLKIEELSRPEIQEACRGANDGRGSQGNQDPTGWSARRRGNGPLRKDHCGIAAAKYYPSQDRLRLLGSGDAARQYRRSGVGQSGYVRGGDFRWR